MWCNSLPRILERLVPRKRLVALLATLFLLLCSSAFFLTRATVDASFMLPGGDSLVARDMRLLARSPFVNNALINLYAEKGTDTATLVKATRTVADTLRGFPELFESVQSGPLELDPALLLRVVLEHAPDLLGKDDLNEFSKQLNPEGVRKALEDNRDMMTTPGGMVFKNVVRADPLNIRQFLFPKLVGIGGQYLMPSRDGIYVTEDGENALIILKSSIRVTDATGAKQVLAAIDTALATLPHGIVPTLVAGHRYALANAGTIKGDLKRILSVSIVSLLVIFLVFLRNRQALLIFLVPGAAIAVAAATTAIFTGSLSGIVIGFGAVLMGISADFALHVYYAVDEGPTPVQAAARVCRPLGMGLATSCCAFGALLISALPGIRQLAVFSLGGLIGAFACSIVLLPLFLKSRSKTTDDNEGEGYRTRGPVSRYAMYGCFALLLAGAIFFGRDVRVTGDPRAFGVTPDGAVEAEQSIRATWKWPKSVALLFASGKTLDEALNRSATGVQKMAEAVPFGSIMTLAHIAPRLETQQANRDEWANFMRQHGERMNTLLHDEAKVMGFSASAFEPFRDWAHTPVPSITSSVIREAGLGNVLDMVAHESDGGYKVLAVTGDTPPLDALFTPDYEAANGVHLISQRKLAQEIGAALEEDFFRFTSASLALTALLLALVFRRPRRILAALLPSVTGMIATLGVYGLLDIQVTIFHVIAIPLVIGLGADYGIFMTSHDTGSTRKAVFVSGLTTLAGFGVLILAKHPALHAIGFGVTVGIVAALAAALLITPAVLSRQKAQQGKAA